MHFGTSPQLLKRLFAIAALSLLSYGCESRFEPIYEVADVPSFGVVEERGPRRHPQRAQRLTATDSAPGVRRVGHGDQRRGGQLVQGGRDDRLICRQAYLWQRRHDVRDRSCAIRHRPHMRSSSVQAVCGVALEVIDQCFRL